MSSVIAADSDGNACVEKGLYRSAMLLIMPADSDGNADVENVLY